MLRSAIRTVTQKRAFIIPTKKTNVVNVFQQTERKIPKGTNAVVETEKNLLQKYDPTGAKQQFLSRKNPDCVKVGDVVRIKKKDGTTFVGMAIAINRHNVSSTIVLRNKVHGTAVEMVYNIFNPEFTSIEVVRRALKDKTKAKLYYLRGNVKYDVGDLDAEIRKQERRRR